jgi:hypothetical protein
LRIARPAGHLKNKRLSDKKQLASAYFFWAPPGHIRRIKISLEIVPEFSAKVCGHFSGAGAGNSAFGSGTWSSGFAVPDNLAGLPCEYPISGSYQPGYHPAA